MTMGYDWDKAPTEQDEIDVIATGSCGDCEHRMWRHYLGIGRCESPGCPCQWGRKS